MADNNSNPNNVHLDGAQDDISSQVSAAGVQSFKDLAPQIWAYQPQPPQHVGEWKMSPDAVQSEPTGD